MSESAAELEQRAERAVRRGELLSALELYEALLARQPDDDRVRQRMESVRDLLQPSELQDRRRSEPDENEETGLAEPLTDAEQGELHASAGRFAEALRCYQRALDAAPHNELLRERLEELRSLAPPGTRADLDAAERLEAATPARGLSKTPARSHKVAHASFAPMETATKPLPSDPIELLKTLLERVRSGRRA